MPRTSSLSTLTGAAACCWEAQGPFGLVVGDDQRRSMAMRAAAAERRRVRDARRRLGRLVLIVAPHPVRPRIALVATPWRAVQQGVVGHRGLEAAGRGHVGPVDDPVR